MNSIRNIVTAALLTTGTMLTTGAMFAAGADISIASAADATTGTQPAPGPEGGITTGERGI